MIDFDVKLPFRMHAGKPAEVIHRRHIYQFRKQGDGYCPYKLYAPKDRLLPFQIFIPISEGADMGDMDINDMFFYNCNGSYHSELGDYANLYNEFELKQEYGVGVWIIYKGQNPITAMNFAGGYYYFVIQLNNNNGREVISELFYVPCDNDFAKLVKFEFWNTCDFANVIYQTGFKNYCYFDTTLLKKEPTIEETGFENGFGEFQLTSSRMINTYKFQEIVPEFLVDALVFMKMHNEIHITIPEVNQTSKFAVKKIGQGWDNDGMLCDVTLELEQEQRLYKGSCCENKIFSALVPPLAVANVLKMDLDNINYEGTAGWVVNGSNNTNFSLLSNDIGYGITVQSVGSFPTTAGGQVILYANGTFKYLKPLAYWAQGSQPFVDTFSYTIVDAYGATSTTVVTLNFDFIHPVNNSVQCNPPVGVSPSVTGNLLSNDHIPISYNIFPTIYHEGLPIVSNKITHYSANPNCIGNYIEIDIYSGQFTYYNVANVNSNFIFDVFYYRIWKSVGFLTTTAQIIIAF